MIFNQKPAGSDDRGQLLTPAQVSEILQVPVATLYRWRYYRVGPRAGKVGRHLRYRRDEIDRWLREEAEVRR